MAKDFSNPKKLGFMRVLQFFFAFNVIVTISLLAFLIKGSYELEFSNILDFVNLIFDSISFWLIWQRKRLARHFIIGFSLFNIFIGTAFNIATGHFSLVGQLFSCTPDLILLAYFLTSRRAKAVLTQPFDAEVKQRELAKDLDCYQPRTWAFWRNIIIYFCVFSVVGHWMEAAYCTLIRFGMIPGTYDPNSQIWSDWLYPSRTSSKSASAAAWCPCSSASSLTRSSARPSNWSWASWSTSPALTASCPYGTTPICSATSWARCVCRTPSPSAWWPRS